MTDVGIGWAFDTFFGNIFGLFNRALEWFGNLVLSAFVALWDMLTDAACWIFDQALGLVLSALGALDLTGITNNLSSYGSIPGDVMQMLGAIGLGPALEIIGAAIVIRFTLQLIPFVRLGS